MTSSSRRSFAAVVRIPLLTLALSCAITLLATACQSDGTKTETKSGTRASGQTDTADVGDEVSLKADRSQFDELRKDVPEEIKRSNDELAFIRDLMKEGDEEPATIRERFSKAVRDRRDKFDKDAHRRRDDFNRREKKEREDFLKKLKSDREEFLSQHKNLKSEARKDFFDEQEAQRTDFFADQKDNRRDFESNETEARKTLESYMTEKRSQFEQEIREYTNTYYERKKNIDLKKRMEEKAKAKAKREAEQGAASGADGASAGGSAGASAGASGARRNSVDDKDLEEFKAIPKSPATPLTPPDNY